MGVIVIFRVTPLPTPTLPRTVGCGAGFIKKGVNMEEQALKEFIEFVRTASPVIWQALYKQVYVEAIGFVAWSVVMLILTVILVRFGKFAGVKEKKGGYLNDWGLVQGFSYFLAAVTTLVAFGLFLSFIMRFANPEFYAFRLILFTIGGAR